MNFWAQGSHTKMEPLRSFVGTGTQHRTPIYLAFGFSEAMDRRRAVFIWTRRRASRTPDIRGPSYRESSVISEEANRVGSRLEVIELSVCCKPSHFCPILGKPLYSPGNLYGTRADDGSHSLRRGHFGAACRYGAVWSSDR